MVVALVKTAKKLAASLVILLAVAACTYTDHFTVTRSGNQVFYNHVGELTGQKGLIGKPNQICGSPLLVESVTTSHYIGIVVWKYPISKPEYNYTITCKDESRMSVSFKNNVATSDSDDEGETED